MVNVLILCIFIFSPVKLIPSVYYNKPFSLNCWLNIVTNTILYLLASFLLVNCHSNNKNIPNTADLTLIDTTEMEAVFLYDSVNILTIGVSETNGKKFIATRFGFFKRKGDTIMTDAPLLGSDEFNKIKTKLFWVKRQHYEYVEGSKKMIDSSYMNNFFKDPWDLADSLFHLKLPDTTALVFIPFPKDTFYISGGKLNHKNAR